MWQAARPSGSVEAPREVVLTLEQLPVHTHEFNAPPDAKDDVFEIYEDTALAGNLLDDNGNGFDSDPDGDTLAVDATAIVGPSAGRLTLDADGSVLLMRRIPTSTAPIPSSIAFPMGPEAPIRQLSRSPSRR